MRAATDITGFGLLGHAYEMAEAGGMRFVIEADEVPLLDGAWDYAAAGLTTGGGAQRRYLLEPDAAAGLAAPRVTLARPCPDPLLALLLDPQTSGGLLVAIPRATMATSARASAMPASSSTASAKWPKGAASRSPDSPVPARPNFITIGRAIRHPPCRAMGQMQY